MFLYSVSISGSSSASFARKVCYPLAVNRILGKKLTDNALNQARNRETARVYNQNQAPCS